MDLLSKSALCAALGFLLFGCGSSVPDPVTFDSPEREVSDFGDEIAPLNLGVTFAGEGATFATAIRSDEFSEREVKRASQEVINNTLVNNRLFEIPTNNKWYLRIDDISVDYSSCSLPPEAQLSAENEIVINIFTGASKVGQISLEQVNLGNPYYVDVSGLAVDEDDASAEVKFVNVELDVLPSSCANISASLTYSLSDLELPDVEEEGIDEDEIEVRQEQIDTTEPAELVYSFTATATDTANLFAYDRNSLNIFSFDNSVESFAKVLFLSPELDECGLNTPEAFSASEALRFNLVGVGTDSNRFVIGSDILNSDFNYESVDYSAFSEAFVEIDNVPLSCESVIARIAHWRGSTQMSPEPMRQCSLISEANSSSLVWSPALESFVINDSDGNNILNASDLCSNSQVSSLRDELLGSNVEIETDEDTGDKSYFLLLDNQRVADISCSFSGRLNFIHYEDVVLCSEMILDADEVANRVVSSPSPNSESGEEEAGEGLTETEGEVDTNGGAE